MTYFILIFLVVTVLWLCFWVLVRPVILDSVESDFSKLRSEIDWAIIEGLPSAQSQSSQKLADDLADPEAVRWISVGPILWANIFKRNEIKLLSAKEREIFESAPSWIRQCKMMEKYLTIKAALLNSPAWWIPLPAILFSTLLSKKVADWWNDAESAASKSHSKYVGFKQPI